MVGEQTSGIQSRSLRAETRNLEIQDGEDVDVLQRPGPERSILHEKHIIDLKNDENINFTSFRNFEFSAAIFSIVC